MMGRIACCVSLILTVVLAANLVQAADAPAAGRPNVVLVLADDLGYGDLGCYGCPDIRTPSIDRLASQGVRFTCFYSNGPECTPTRTALLTGRYQQRVEGMECAIGVGNVGRYDDAIRRAERRDLGLPAEEITVTQLLSRGGYTVAGFGKWHLGYEPKFSPARHGFERFFGPLGGAVDYFFHCEPDGTPMLFDNGKPVEREGYMTDLVTQSAVEFLRNQKGSKPFFLYLPYTAPHTPLQSPGEKPAARRNDDDWNEGDRQTYTAMVERLDRGVGEVLQALDASGLSNRTLVIFASDNGGTKIGRNAPFSGQKGGLYEGGIRVPCIARMPGTLPAGKTFDQPAMTMDLTVSIARLADVARLSPRPMDGVDVLAFVADGKPLPPRLLFWRARRGDRTWRAVREGSLKYVARQDGEKVQEQLFDLDADPAEKQDLLKAQPEAAARLKRAIADWETRVRPGGSR